VSTHSSRERKGERDERVRDRVWLRKVIVLVVKMTVKENTNATTDNSF
jgi:hypothetical protein